jgi:hypothetical protein
MLCYDLWCFLFEGFCIIFGVNRIYGNLLVNRRYLVIKRLDWWVRVF